MKQSDILRAESVGCCHDKKRLTCRTEDLAQRRCGCSGISLSPLLHLQSNRTEVSVTHPRHLQSNRTEVSVTHSGHLQSNRTEVSVTHSRHLQSNRTKVSVTHSRHLQSNRTEISVTHSRHLQSNRTEVSVTHSRHLQSNRTEVNNCHCNTLPPPNGDRHTITTATDNNNNNNTDFQSGWSGLRWKCLTMAPGPQRHDNKAGEGGNGRGYRKYSHFIPGSNMRGKHDKQFTLKFNSAC